MKMPRRVPTPYKVNDGITCQMKCLFVLLISAISFGATAGELGDLLRTTLQHPQIRAATDQTEAARSQVDASTGRYFGSAVLSTGWHRYEGERVVGVFTPGTPMVPLISDHIAQTGISYSLPVDVFGVIAANKERAQYDLRATELLGRQQTVLKLHQAATAYLTLQSLIRQKEALELSRKRIDATYQRVRKEFELGKAAGVDARYAESEVARLNADQVVLDGAVSQAQADIAEATGEVGFLPTIDEIRVPDWDVISGVPLTVQLAQARAQSAQAQADESHRALLPSLNLDTNYFRNSVPGGDHRDTWAVGGVLSLPLGVSQYRQASAQKLVAAAAAEQSEAAARDSDRQLSNLHAVYESALADANAMEKEVAYREEVAHVEQSMHQLGSQTLENLFRHERDLLDARYRLTQARARAAAAWSAAQVIVGLSADIYITRMDAK